MKIIYIFLQEYSDINRSKQLEHILQMSLLQQDKNASNGNVDPMQFQHQQLMSQFQRTVSIFGILFRYFVEWLLIYF